MKQRPLISLLAVLLILAQLACNFSALTDLAGASPTPSATPVLPTATFTAVPPTPTPPTPPTNTLPPPTLAPPTVPPTVAPTNTLVPTLKPTVHPVGGARFSGSFAGGVLVFRVNDAGTYVTLKEVTLNKAKCGAKEVNKHMTFETISFFAISNGEFSLSDEQATLSGVFDTNTSAHGSLTLKFNANKTACTIGPVSWTATAQ